MTGFLTFLGCVLAAVLVVTMAAICASIVKDIWEDWK